ncbi:hypothetical protein LEP1GSC192_1215 [Leptospira sp. B5-022]|nr:hypothetical protein LEP1GSC192_1215 [Leptospira sp. B5-022]
MSLNKVFLYFCFFVLAFLTANCFYSLYYLNTSEKTDKKWEKIDSDTDKEYKDRWYGPKKKPI